MMTNEQLAIKQWLSKPAPYFDACGCMGPQNNMPRCPCKMQMVEKVNHVWFEIIEHRDRNGITHTAMEIGQCEDI